MRALIIAAAALAVATPSQALPLWAESIARSECEYYAMGVGFPEALQQALRDNRHWSDEIKEAGSGIAAKAIMVATFDRCQKLQQDAYKASKRNSI
jgi:hypothetical protein